MKKVLYLLVLALCFSFASANLCYQESATSDTSCGGLGTGNYIDRNFGIHSSYIYDNDWNTGSKPAPVPVGFLDINYTKPHEFSSAYWKVGIYDGSYKNYTVKIPYNCFRLMTNFIGLRITVENKKYVSLSCMYNYTNVNIWKNITVINTEGKDTYLYDEGLYWNDGPQPETCYQETANKSEITDWDCGLKYTGSYDYSGWFYPGSRLIDGNWSSWSISSNPSFNNYGYLYVNYTKPENYTSAVWTVGYSLSPSIPMQIKNISIPSNCWDYDSQKIYLKLVSFSDINNVKTNISYYCQDSSGWEYLDISSDNSISSFFIYEEGIYWNIKAVPLPDSFSYTGWSGPVWHDTWVYANDKNWNTYAEIYQAGGSLLFNYTKHGSSGTWKIRDSNGNHSITIPDSCFNYYPDKISLRMNGPVTASMNSQCYNGNWIDIGDATNRFYEGEIIWSNNYYCYQENTNSSNINDGNCTLNYNGDYLLEGDKWIDGPNDAFHVYDGDWNTGAEPHNYTTGAMSRGNFTIRYVKPSQSVNAVWIYKEGDANYASTYNSDIPEDCFNYDGNLLLRIESWQEDCSGFWAWHINNYCFNGTWKLISTNGPECSGEVFNYGMVFDEGIKWTIDYSKRKVIDPISVNPGINYPVTQPAVPHAEKTYNHEKKNYNIVEKPQENIQKIVSPEIILLNPPIKKTTFLDRLIELLKNIFINN